MTNLNGPGENLVTAESFLWQAYQEVPGGYESKPELLNYYLKLAALHIRLAEVEILYQQHERNGA
jgi:hypothetical protein